MGGWGQSKAPIKSLGFESETWVSIQAPLGTDKRLSEPVRICEMKTQHFSLAQALSLPQNLKHSCCLVRAGDSGTKLLGTESGFCQLPAVTLGQMTKPLNIPFFGPENLGNSCIYTILR